MNDRTNEKENDFGQHSKNASRSSESPPSRSSPGHDNVPVIGMVDGGWSRGRYGRKGNRGVVRDKSSLCPVIATGVT